MINFRSVTYFTLETVFKHSFKKGKFPEKWKTENVVPVHKKGRRSFGQKLLSC